MDETKKPSLETQEGRDHRPGGVGETVINPVATPVDSAVGVASQYSTDHGRAANLKSKLNRQTATGSSDLSRDERLQDRIASKKKKKAAHRRKLKRSQAKG
jgi:hypothetical protein